MFMRKQQVLKPVHFSMFGAENMLFLISLDFNDIIKTFFYYCVDYNKYQI